MPSVHILTKTKTLMMLPVELVKMMDIFMIEREGTDSDDGDDISLGKKPLCFNTASAQSHLLPATIVH